ncbi:ABC transporter permease [Desulfohalovibrio reitneri]|uniref:ABC transporter permease n=1 Tax=Desulfohalovibrio reitneri TaxID=1307759 RepID=UPI0004A6E6E3|nr:FtsX-like permease family protein [Desulfohalovibrio reitneri]
MTLPLSLRLARRELRQGFSRFGVFLACLTLGVGLISLVGSLSSAADEGIRRDARAILGGDLEITSTFQPPPEPVRRELEESGRVSRVLTMRTMARLPAENARLLVELKAVDDAYPLFGQMELDPSQPLDAALAERGGRYGAAVEPELLERMGASVGDVLRVGSADIEIRAAIQREPDRAVSLFTLGPRLLISRPAAEATGLLLPGSMIRHKLRADLRGADAQAVAEQLRADYPDAGWRVRDFTSAGPRLRRFMDNLDLYLTFTGLAAILVGGLGMGGAVSSFLEMKNRSIAVMKTFGAESGLILRVYLAQVLFLTLLGCAAGAILGGGLPALAAESLQSVLPVPLAAGIYPLALLKAAGFGLLTALSFSLPPLLRAGRVRGASLFRGYADPGRTGLPARARAAVVLAALALAGYTVAVTSDHLLALSFCGAALGALAVFRMLAWAVRKTAFRIRPRGRPRLRLALSALHRPGNATQAVLFALGLGLTVLTAVNLAGGNLRNQIALALPERAPSFFFIDIQPAQAERFDELVRSLKGVNQLRRQPMLRARITRIGGRPVEEVDIPEEFRWTVRSDRGVTYRADPPPGNEIVAGKWWGADYSGPPLLSFPAEIAKGYGAGVGDTLTVNLLGREITAEIANLREVEWSTLAMNFTLVFPPGILENAPQTHIATVYADTGSEAGVLSQVSDAFPNVSGIRIKEVLQRVADLLGSIGQAVRAVALAAIVTGVLVLASALRAGTRRRVFEAVVMRVVGATSRDILAVLTLELVLLGVVAGIAAAGLGVLLSWLLVEEVMNLQWTFMPGTALLTVGAATAVTVLLGLSGMRRVLRQKPAEILRNE